MKRIHCDVCDEIASRPLQLTAHVPYRAGDGFNYLKEKHDFCSVQCLDAWVEKKLFRDEA